MVLVVKRRSSASVEAVPSRIAVAYLTMTRAAGHGTVTSPKAPSRRSSHCALL